MYARGAIIDHISRFGRWASDTCRRYLYRANQAFRFSVIQWSRTRGSLGQLQMTLPEPRRVTFATDNDEGGSE